MKELFRKSSGYRYMDAFVIASITELATEHFCRKFLNLKNDPGGRTFSQMTHAARSGCRNFAEGSERIKTSYATAIKLLDVARASLCELRDDFNKWVMLHWQVPWEQESDEAQRVYKIRLDTPDYGKDVNQVFCRHVLNQYKKFEPNLSSDDAMARANTLIILIRRTIIMLEKYIQKVGEDFTDEGGFHERMSDVRHEARTHQNKPSQQGPACPECGEITILRKARKDNHEFWGCSAFPACRGVVNIVGKSR